MNNQVLSDLISEHISFLASYRSHIQKKEKSSEVKIETSDSGSDEEEVEVEDEEENEEQNKIIKERLEYLQDEQNFLPEHIHILFDDIYDERVGETLGYAISAFNHELIKIAKSFAISITISHHMPSVGQIIDIITNNKVCRSIVIDAEYFNADLLTDLMFVNALNSAPNLHFLRFAIGEQGEYDAVDPTEITEFLSGKLHEDIDLCITWTCGYFFIKERGKSQVSATFVKEGEEEELEEENQNLSIIHKNSLSTMEDFQNAIEQRDSFNIILMYQGIASEFVQCDQEIDVSQYYHNLDIFHVNMEQEFDTWRLIDYAAYHRYTLLIHEFYRSSKINLGKSNGDGRTVLEVAIENGTPEVIAALIGLSLPLSQSNNINLNPDNSAILNTVLNCGKTLLMLAASKDKKENLEFLLRLGVDCNKIHYGKTALDLALEGGYYDCVLLLLKSGSKFPKNFDINVDEGLASFCNECALMTEVLIKGDLSKIEYYIKMGTLTAYFLGMDNHSAPYIAFSAKQYEVYALLRSRGFALMEDEQIDVQFFTNQERTLLQKYMMSFSNKHAYSSISFLMSKSKILQPNNQHLETVQYIYTKLSDIPEVLHVFRVLEYSGKHFDILFDFEQDNVAEISASTSQNTAGSCVFKVGYVFIAGKVVLDQLMGTTAHELTHQAIDVLYSNDCNPFLNQDIEAIERLTAIEKEIQKSAKNDIIKRVFKCYQEKDWHAEIIVRVPHILATYGVDQKGKELLEIEAPGLRNFYEEYVVKKCESFVQEVQNRGVKGLTPETALSISCEGLNAPKISSAVTISYGAKELIENWSSIQYMYKEIILPLLPAIVHNYFEELFDKKLKTIQEALNYDAVWLSAHVTANIIGIKSLSLDQDITQIVHYAGFNTATYAVKYYAYKVTAQISASSQR